LLAACKANDPARALRTLVHMNPTITKVFEYVLAAVFVIFAVMAIQHCHRQSHDRKPTAQLATPRPGPPNPVTKVTGFFRPASQA